VLSQKIVENLVSHLYEDANGNNARAYREALMNLVRAAKAEQRVMLSEQKAVRSSVPDNVLSIESYR
jgi:hypothetical protein